MHIFWQKQRLKITSKSAESKAVLFFSSFLMINKLIANALNEISFYKEENT